MNFKDPNGQLARWLEELSQYWMVIHHRPGSKHINADALSRMGEDNSCKEYRHAVQPQDLPCGGCNYCLKRHSEWSRFIECVDEAVPLTHLAHTVQQITKKPAVMSWMSGYTWDDIRNYQRQDEDLTLIIEWLENNKQPTEDILFLSSPVTKHYWITRELFFLEESGVLWRKKC